MPSALGWREVQPPRVVLTLFGLACVPAAQPLLAAYAATIGLALERFDDASLPNRLTRSEVDQELDLDPRLANQLSALLMLPGNPFLAGGQAEPASWDQQIDERIVSFEQVRTPEDLVNELARQRDIGRSVKDPASRPCSALRRIVAKLATYGVVGWSGIVAAVAAVIGTAVLIEPGLFAGGSRDSSPGRRGALLARQTSQLAARTNGQLSLRETPRPGASVPTLGFGDAAGGRTTYVYTNGLFHAPLKPTFDAIRNAPYGVGDERQFVHVIASRTKDLRQIGYFSGRSALAMSSDVVYLTVRVDNNAAPSPGCRPVGPTIARDTTLRLNIWNSRDGTTHVIRAWLTARNLHPAWITDAVAVVTTEPTTLEPDAKLSRQYVESSPRYQNNPLLDAQPALDFSGLLVGDGNVGSCWQDESFLGLALRQT